MDPDRRLAATAERQHGLVTRPQALALGLSAFQIEHRRASGRLRVVRRSVYALAGVPPTWEQAVLAACLAAGPAAFASHLTAARLWGLHLPEPDRIDLLTSTGRHVDLSGVRHRRTTALYLVDLTTVRGIPTTTPARTLVDCASTVPPTTLGSVVDDADRRRIARLAQIRACHARLASGRGRRPTAALRQVLDERTPGHDPGGSERELWVKRMLERAGLACPVQQHRVRIGHRTLRLDLAYPGRRVAIEFDGWDTHRTFAAFHADRDRLRRLAAAGWTVVPVTARTSATALVRDVAAVLANCADSTGT